MGNFDSLIFCLKAKISLFALMLTSSTVVWKWQFLAEIVKPRYACEAFHTFNSRSGYCKDGFNKFVTSVKYIYFFFFLRRREGGVKGWCWVTAVNPRRASTVTTKTPRKKRKRMTNDDDNNLCGWKTTLGPANGGQRENLSQALSIKNKFSQKLEFFQNLPLFYI